MQVGVINKIMQSNKVLQMLYRKRLGKKQSQSSIKFPAIPKKQSHSNKSSAIKINASQVSIQSLNPQLRMSHSKPSINNYRLHNPYKKKSRSRAQPVRVQTQGIGKDISFQSPVNSIINNQLDNTLQDFIKNVERNKQYILKERNKKIQQNRYMSEKSLKQQKQEKKKPQCYLKSQQAQLFQKAHNIISKNVMSSCQLNLDEVNKTLINQKIIKIMKRVHPDKSVQNLKIQLMSQIANQKKIVSQIKGEKNYSQWRRTNILSTQQSIRYKRSSFENESQRVGDLTLKTQATICKYLQNRKILLDLRNKIQKSS